MQSPKLSNNKKIRRLYNVKVEKLFKMIKNSLFHAFNIKRQWCHYSQKEHKRKYAAVIIGHCFFSCYTQLYYKVQEAWTNGYCYLCIFKLAISPKHIFEKEFNYHSK